MSISGLPTHFGDLGLTYRFRNGEGVLELAGSAKPPAGFVVRLPKNAEAAVAGAKTIRPGQNGDVALPPGAVRLTIRFSD